MSISQFKIQLRRRYESDLFASPFSEAQFSLRPFFQVNLWAPLVLLTVLAFVLGALPQQLIS